jgi:hypothetical protein
MTSCPCSQADFNLPLNGPAVSFTSAYGIQSDTVLGAAALQLYKEKGVMLSDPGAITRLFDSLLRQRYVVARVQGYATSIRAGLGAYYVRTSEGRYASLIIFDQFIGGINKYYYYWSYQNDGSRALYKGSGPKAKNDSVIINPHIFSGRMDPVFVIRDSVNVAAIKRKVDSISSVIYNQGIPVTGNVRKWPGMTVTYFPPLYSSMLYFPLETGKDSIVQVVPNTPRAAIDKGNLFERFIVDILIKEDPVSVIGADTIEAAVLFKQFDPFNTGISPNRRTIEFSPEVGNRIHVVPHGRVLELLLDSPRHVSITMFDGQGRRLAMAHEGMIKAGRLRVALPRPDGASRVALIRVSMDGRTSIVRTVGIR